VSVVVTGAASGIGAAVTAALTAQDTDVIGLDVAAADGVPDFDVTDEQAWAMLAADLRDRDIRVHGLVHCAGTTWRARLGEVIRRRSSISDALREAT
jgi:3alpha(or 20beta)-hydroxysteroid dehydrogenase